MGSQEKKQNMSKKEVKGDLQNVKHIKLKLHNFYDVSFYNSIYILFIYSRYTFMLEGASFTKLITGWQFNKFLRSFLFLQKITKLFFSYTYTFHTHEFHC